MKPIAFIHSDFTEKFGIPRQSGLVPSARAEIHFEPEFRSAEALRGIEGFSHLWLLWLFSKSPRGAFSPTVRPPKLGGNTRMGVFATRSPVRPNPIGLSCVTLEEVRLHTPNGPMLIVGGADLLDGTPILDIKPYLPYADSHPDARAGFTAQTNAHALRVTFPPDLLCLIDEPHRPALLELLAADPRPGYQSDPLRVYGVAFAGYNVRFTVCGDALLVCEVQKL